MALEDHPRACGENIEAYADRAQDGGSPPRVRGKLSTCRPRPRSRGITPARAGKTCYRTRRESLRMDHPRACGENASCKFSTPSPKGSPPRVRGKRYNAYQEIKGNRITPARAGKTHTQHKNRCFSWDHPRACGENVACLISCLYRSGSPPRVRGKPCLRRRGRSSERITPARAGKTFRFLLPAPRQEDHPRACGENSYRSVRSPSGAGSPPRVRGKLKR